MIDIRLSVYSLYKVGRNYMKNKYDETKRNIYLLIMFSFFNTTESSIPTHLEFCFLFLEFCLYLKKVYYNCLTYNQGIL